MRWKVFFGLSLAFLSGLFLTQSSFAASSSITPVVGSVESIDVSNLSFTPHFLVFDLDYSAANTFQKTNANYQVGSNIYGNPFNTNFSDTFCTYYVRFGNKLTQLVCSFDSTLSPVYRINPIFADQFAVGITMTLYDVLPGESEPCPECPPVPDLPYGEKLDKLTNAVFIVAATMLVLYFFFAIYNMFFKGLK